MSGGKFMFIKKTIKLSISNNYLLDDESSKKVMEVPKIDPKIQAV